jgi:hypothetical protein
MTINVKRSTRELFEEYLERLPVKPAPDESSTILFIGSNDLDNNDKE